MLHLPQLKHLESADPRLYDALNRIVMETNALLVQDGKHNVLVETGDPMGSAPLSRTNAIDFTVTAP